MSLSLILAGWGGRAISYEFLSNQLESLHSILDESIPLFLMKIKFSEKMQCPYFTQKVLGNGKFVY